MGRKKRTLIHEPEYANAYDKLTAEDARYHEVIAGLEWGIATHAECYPALPAALGVLGLHVAPSDPIGDLDPLRIFFTIDSDDEATLFFIERIDREVYLAEMG